MLPRRWVSTHLRLARPLPKACQGFSKRYAIRRQLAVPDGVLNVLVPQCRRAHVSWPSLASLEPQAWRREKWGLLTDDDLDVINERQEHGDLSKDNFYPRESNDTPSEDAFCRVALGVRLSDFAIFAAGVF